MAGFVMAGQRPGHLHATALFHHSSPRRKPGSSFERCKLKLESGLRPNDDDRHSPVADARIKSAHDVY
jgi:hypothetical protein